MKSPDSLIIATRGGERYEVAPHLLSFSTQFTMNAFAGTFRAKIVNVGLPYIRELQQGAILEAQLTTPEGEEVRYRGRWTLFTRRPRGRAFRGPSSSRAVASRLHSSMLA